MNIVRLRPLPSPEELAVMYAEPHDHRRWGRGHSERVAASIAMGQDMLSEQPVESIGDLSCGNAMIARTLASGRKIDVILGDMGGPPDRLGRRETFMAGSLDETIEQIPHVDLMISCESLEHLDAPSVALAGFRAKADRLLLSTPTDNWDDSNGEHLYAWSRAGVESLLTATGWRDNAYDEVDSRVWGEPYKYSLWSCS